VGVLNIIYDIMLAHNVPPYVATRKLRVFKVTPPQLSTPGAKSAVYDCLVFYFFILRTYSFVFDF